MAPAKKTTAKKVTVKKPVAKKATPKKVVKKTTAKTTTVKKTAVKKAPVKKPVAKKAAPKKVVKKTTAKKAAPKKVVKAATNVESVVSAPVKANDTCPCVRCSFSGFIKKLIVFLVIFALGFASCKYMHCGSHHFRKGMDGSHNMNRVNFFTDGCLDMDKVQDTKLAEHLVKVTANADTNKDGCISMEEFKNADRSNVERMNNKKMNRGPKGPMKK